MKAAYPRSAGLGSPPIASRKAPVVRRREKKEGTEDQRRKAEGVHLRFAPHLKSLPCSPIRFPRRRAPLLARSPASFRRRTDQRHRSTVVGPQHTAAGGAPIELHQKSRPSTGNRGDQWMYGQAYRRPRGGRLPPHSRPFRSLESCRSFLR